MFVVDDVETAAPEPVHYPGHFEDESSVRSEQFGYVAYEAVQVRNMRYDIVRGHKLRRFTTYEFDRIPIEESGDYFDIFVLGSLREICRGFDPDEVPHTVLMKRFQ